MSCGLSNRKWLGVKIQLCEILTDMIAIGRGIKLVEH